MNLKWLVLCIAILTTPLLRAAASEPTRPFIQAFGTGVDISTATQVSLQVAVVSEQPTADLALEENTNKTQKVQAALANLGFKDTEISTGAFSVQPQWSSPPQNPPADWRPNIIGYVAENQVSLTTSHIDRIGKAITAASTAGANRIGDLNFSLADDQAARANAISKATAAALAAAQTMAHAANTPLGKIQEIELVGEPTGLPMASAKMLRADTISTPISPGSIETQATVRVRLQLP